MLALEVNFLFLLPKENSVLLRIFFVCLCLFLVVVFVIVQINIIEQMEDKVILNFVLFHFSDILNW